VLCSGRRWRGPWAGRDFWRSCRAIARAGLWRSPADAAESWRWHHDCAAPTRWAALAQRYFRVPEAWTKVEKLAWLAEQPFSSIAWRELTPDARHLWLTEGMHAAFATFLPLGTKATKAGRATESEAIFKNYSNGLKTCRKDGVIINPALTLTGLPAACFGYRLGNRSALEWLIDQYQVSSDKRSGLTNDPNRTEDEEYIVRLVGRIVTVSIETVQLVEALAAWDVGVAGA